MFYVTVTALEIGTASSGDGDAAYWEAEGIHDDVVKPLWEEIPALDNPELLSDDVKE